MKPAPIVQLVKYPKSFIVGVNNVGSQKASALAPCNVILDSQNTSLGPEKTSPFLALHIQTKISKSITKISKNITKISKNITNNQILVLFSLFILLFSGTVTYVCRKEIEKLMQQKMISSIPLYKNNSFITNYWDSMHKEFKCCGVVVDNDAGYEIWRKLNWNFSSFSNQVPESCCRRTDQQSVWLCQQDPKIGAYDIGCYDQVKDFIRNKVWILAGIGIVVYCLTIRIMLSYVECMIKKMDSQLPLVLKI